MFSLPRTLKARVYHVARLLAVVGQLACVFAAGFEGHGRRSAVQHVENHGIDLHYAHNEATCVACTTLAFYASGEVSRPVVFDHVAQAGAGPTHVPATVVARADFSSHLSRAPPRVG